MPAATTPQNYVTTEDLRQFGEALSKQIIDEVTDILQGFMTHVDDRFNKVEARLDRVETRLDKIETRLDKVETRLNTVETRLDKVEIRLENVEVRLDSSAVKLDKLEAGQVTINNTLQNLNWD
jgi:archaellum component FlaC